jgi:hypothetical protein
VGLTSFDSFWLKVQTPLTTANHISPSTHTPIICVRSVLLHKLHAADPP